MKVTYILGAGASAQALPTVKGIDLKPGLADALINMANWLEKADINKANKTIVTNTIKNLHEIANESKRFGTTDTYAKFLSLQEKPTELKNLKEAVVIFFLIEQMINKKLDDRPLAFLTTVMENGFTFPNQINIISWNFDFQIQLAASVFKQETFEIKNGGILRSPPLIGYYPPLGSFETLNEFSMIQMNGIAGFFQHRHFYHNYFLMPPSDINELFDHIRDGYAQKINLLTFAWEKNSDILQYRMKIAKKLATGTEILVVIGYSFPFFNREFDKEIFQAMKVSNPSLRKIYFQDPVNDGEFLRNQFDLGNTEIESVSGTNNYFVPLEL